MLVSIVVRAIDLRRYSTMQRESCETNLYYNLGLSSARCHPSKCAARTTPGDIGLLAKEGVRRCPVFFFSVSLDMETVWLPLTFHIPLGPVPLAIAL